MITAALRSIVGSKNRFRDPIYGFIALSDDEVRIVDTSIFQRLRRIHQLALEKYVYTGAEHSRFCHSLGVVHTATRLFESLLSNVTDGLEDIAVSIKTLRFAALLHDIGHLPFSHGIEEELLPAGMKHEQISAHIIEHHPEITRILEGAGVRPSSVAALIVPRKRRVASANEALLKMIISGHLDADRADYLLRDSYYCGVKYGVYDFERYLSAMRVMDVKSPQIWIKSDDVPIIEEFLLARYHSNIQISFHRTRTMYDIALREFVQNEKRNKGEIFRLFEESFSFNGRRIAHLDFEKFETLNDYTFFFYLDRYSREDYWAQCLRRGREHLSMLKEYIRPVRDGLRDMKKALRALARAGFEEGKDFYSWNTDFKLHKFDEEVDPIRVYDKHSRKDLGGIDNYSMLFKMSEGKVVFMWRIYVRADMNEQARKKMIHTIESSL